MQSDFEYAASVYSGNLARRADKFGLSSLSKAERTFVLAWWAKGEIDNGGFALLYSMPVSIDSITSAFREIGQEAAAKACEASKLVFPGGIPPESPEQCALLLKSIDRTIAWLPQEQVIWSLGDAFDAAIADYARRNQLR